MELFRLMFSRRWWWTTLLVIAGIGLAIRMGLWQLDRNAGKRANIQHVLAVKAMPPLDLNHDQLPYNVDEMEYRKVRAVGSFDFEHQVALRNQIWTQSWGDEPGYALLTPLILPDGQAVMVERGWIPSQYDSPESWNQFDEPGEVEVEGILRLPMEKGQMGGGMPDPTLAPGEDHLDFWNFVNLKRMQEQLAYPVKGFYIQQAPTSDPEALPYRWISEPDMDPGAHIGFALMWFFYAGLLFFGYPGWLRKQQERALLKQEEGQNGRKNSPNP
jgi:surfeit locus 1 family protein